jgi:hypothetical protein
LTAPTISWQTYTAVHPLARMPVRAIATAIA